MLHMQQLQHSVGARRLLQKVIIHTSMPSPNWSSRGSSGIRILSTFAPPPLMLSGQSQSSSSSLDTVNHFSPSVAIIMVALLSAFFFLGFFSLYVRRCADSSSLDARASLRRADELQDQQEQGVDPDFLQTLPLIAYSLARKKGSNIECVVCLTDFEECEPLRQLPSCKHFFHQDCIDMWLFSHSTCPLCRCSVTTSSGSMSLRWGGLGNFHHVSLIRGGGGSGQQLALLGGGGRSRQQLNVTDDTGVVVHTERESNDTIVGIQRGPSIELGASSQCHGNLSADMNMNDFLQRPCADMRDHFGYQNPDSMTADSSITARGGSFNASNRVAHGIGSRQQWIAGLKRSNSTGHSLLMEPGPANEANPLLKSSGDPKSSFPRTSFHRSSSEMVEKHGNHAL